MGIYAQLEPNRKTEMENFRQKSLTILNLKKIN